MAGKHTRKGSVGKDRHHKRNASMAAAVSVSLFSFAPLAQAAPSGGNVVSGSATITTPTQLETLINQATDKAVINWNDFSISAGELVKFVQKSSSSVALNRVIGANPSQIMGSLQANGNIFLINPNGIVFGKSATVDVAGLLASTFDISNTDFMNGDYNFTGSLKSGASISNAGTLQVGDNGFVYLIAPNVDNTGHIIANVGSVTLGNDGTYNFDLAGNGLVKFQVSDANDAGVTTSLKNSGQIDGGAAGAAKDVLLSGSQTQDVVSSVVNSGDIKVATSLKMNGSTVTNQNGTVELDVKSGDTHDQISLQGSDPAGSGSVDFQNTSLSSSGTVNGTIKVTNATGGVILNKADVSGDLSVTAAGRITGAGNAGGDASADHLSLTTTAQGADIGGEGNPLNIDANTLSASADQGNIVITDLGGDLSLDQVTTNDNSVDSGLRAIIDVADGSLGGLASGQPNVTAWATNLEADGSIGADGQTVTTDVKVLSASTQDGGIAIDNTGGDLIVNKVSAGERITQNGQTASSTAISNANGDITLSNGAVGTHDVSLAAAGNMVLTNQVTATGDLSLTATGNLYESGGADVLTGRHIQLSAGQAIGQSGAVLSTQSDSVSATSGAGGIYLTENDGLTLGNIEADGGNNTVSLTASQGDLTVGTVTANGGDVSLTAGQGAIKAGASPTGVTADSLTLDAKNAIGSGNAHLQTAVSSLTTDTSSAGAGTFVDNQGNLNALDATTNNGYVSIGANGGVLGFDNGDDTLTLSGGPLGLNFNNTGGDINIGNLDLGGRDLSLTAAGAIQQTAGTLSAGQATLTAGAGIGDTGQLHTDVASLDATAKGGAIDIDNGIDAGTLDLTATASGDVNVNQGGDLDVNSLQSGGAATLTAGGAISGPANGYAVSATNLSLTGNGIGSAATLFATQVSGELNATDTGSGGLYLANVGSLTLLNGQSGGDIRINNDGAAILGTLKAGGKVVFQASGAVTGDGNGTNIQGQSLDLSAESAGTSSTPLVLKVDKLTLNVSNGNIYVNNIGTDPLALQQASATGGDVSIQTAGDMNLGSVSDAGHDVTLTSGGAINDARSDDSVANVQAKNLNMQAQNGVGNNGPLSLDVGYMSVGGGGGSVNAANQGPVAVDSASLEGKGAAGVTIVATSITILDDNGGVMTVGGGNLTLTATNGNIVFLNQNDTIKLVGGGNITLTAKEDPSLTGYNGNIIAGNLTTTDGGRITLNADRNVTLGMLDTGGLGDVNVTARDGVIMDGNGSAENIRGNHVTLIGNTPTSEAATLVRETAISDYAARVAQLNSDTLQLKNLQQELTAYIAMLQTAISNQHITQFNRDQAQSTLNDLSAQLSAAQATYATLAEALDVARVAKDAVEIPAGGAQAIPFSGDGGAEGAEAGLDVVFDAAQAALDAFNNTTLNALSNQVSSAQSSLDVANAYNRDAITAVNQDTSLRNLAQSEVDTTTQAVFSDQVAADASELLRGQAIRAADQHQAIDMSAANPLGVEANQLDMGNSSGTPLDSAVYLTSNGNLGLGNIDSVGAITVKNVAGDIGVVGDVVSPSLITLQADGAVKGLDGILTAPEIALRAGQGIGVDNPVDTDTNVIAADGGNGGVGIANDNGDNALTLGTVDGVSGAHGNGDITLKQSGTLDLKQAIADTDLSSPNTVNLNAGGAIVDDNGNATNVTAHYLNAIAGNAIELDTAVDGLSAHVLNSGDVTLREKDAATLDSVTTAKGNIKVNAGGTLVLGTLATDANGDIDLRSGGAIEDDNINGTRVISHSLELDAADGIGDVGANGTRALDTSVDTVTASAGGETNIENSGDLAVDKVTATSGNVTLTSDSGSLNIGQVDAAGSGATLTLNAAGGIEALDPTATTPQLTAANLALIAGDGIGTKGTVLADAKALEANAGTGGFYLTDENNDLTVGGVTPNLGLPAMDGIKANGDVNLTVSDGALNVNEDVVQNGDGNLDLSAAKDITVNGRLLQAAGNMTLTSQQGGVTLTALSDANATGDIAIHGKGGAVTVNGGSGVTAGGDITVAGQNGDVTVAQGGTVNAGGALTMAADGRIDVSLNAALEARGGDMSLTATHGGIAIGQGSVAISSGDMTVDAKGGDIDATQESGFSSQSNLTLTAQGNINATQGAGFIAGGDLSATATQGDITLADASVYGAGNVGLTAGGAIDESGNAAINVGKNATLTATKDIDLTELGAGGDVSLTSTNGAVQADSTVPVNVTGGKLTISAATGIGAKLSALKTRVASLYATLTGQGDLYLNEADALTVGQADLAGGDAHLTTGGDLTIDRINDTGNVVLDSAGLIHTDTGGLVTADGLDATAVSGIDLNTALSNATLAVTGSGNLSLANTGDLTLNSARAADGDIAVTNQSGNLGIGDVAVSGEHTVALQADGAIRAAGDGAIDSRHVSLNAGTGIGDQGGALNLDAATVNASSAAGDINLAQTGPVDLQTVSTGDGAIDVAVTGGDALLGDIATSGDVSLSSADGALLSDGASGAGIAGDRVTLSAADGIGAAGHALHTAAGSLDATVSGAGDILVDEKDGLASLNASAADGDITVSTASGDLTVGLVQALTPGNAVMLYADQGSILDGNGDANNIVASLLALRAAHGVARASDPLDVAVSTVAADGGDAGVYLNNTAKGPLTVGTVAGLSGLHGDGSVALTTAGDLNLDQAVGSSGGDITLTSGGNVDQQSDLDAAGDIRVNAAGDVTMAGDSQSQSTNNGDIKYRAGGDLTVNRLSTGGGISGGTIELQGRTLAEAGPAAQLRGGQVAVFIPGVSRTQVQALLDNPANKASISLNGRVIGGDVARNARFIQDMAFLPGTTAAAITINGVSYRPDSNPAALGFQPDGGIWSFTPGH